MGMSISASLIYGLPYNSELSDLEGIEEMLDDGDLDYASPHYDSPRDEWICGVSLPKVIADENEMLLKIQEAKAKFQELTGGMTGKILVSANVN